MAFFSGASHVDASHGVFNNIAGNQHNNFNTGPRTEYSGTFNGSTINHNIREGPTYNHHRPVHHGDRFYGPIYGGAVGGRGNTNVIYNNGGPEDWRGQERQMEEQLQALQAKLEAHRRRQRFQNLQAELAEAQAQFDNLSDRED